MEVSQARIADALERIADVLEAMEVQKYGLKEFDGTKYTPARYRYLMKRMRANREQVNYPHESP